ncbi:hypothetical protein [Agrobacterium tumefaciens]|uniref:hypothetical protein n=1 Tax=Agrobacterium tumefaciens TaxID=358 RepID=UPI002340C901|nr:hypothetical protein [Agrobacterium tumefaciens]WCJ63102.1 hypothetical protein G6M15_02545 [Agrobacterium tumefaciens]
MLALMFLRPLHRTALPAMNSKEHICTTLQNFGKVQQMRSETVRKGKNGYILMR